MEIATLIKELSDSQDNIWVNIAMPTNKTIPDNKTR